uniref:Carbohydrate-binding domain-containing protein n=1 Tax=Arcella intermedia TaxID=1963864 RepID=A0A6B2L877_9EUKA
MGSEEKITFDGRLDEEAWEAVPWSGLFVDIQGDKKPKPYLETRMKMRWDEEYLYIAGWLEEPQAWANLTYNNSVIFYDNDFEVFIDVDGSNHYYKELELNARNLNWNLLLVRPYLNGGPPVCNYTQPGQCQESAPGVPYWDISPDLPSGVHLEGTLNDPTQGSKLWTIEIGIPISQYLRYCPTSPAPPAHGSYWRIDFSRVEWHVMVGGAPPAYWKKPGVPEENWVWQPTYVDPPNMHLPETWGYIQFSTDPALSTPLVRDPEWVARDALMKVYYAETEYYAANKRYTDSLALLVGAGLPRYVAEGKCAGVPAISFDDTSFLATVSGVPGKIGHVRNDRLLWFQPTDVVQ